jgi:glycosyltransferase involved in cell wall biosynthesis
MRIALDASAAAKEERTGVGRYATWLMDALFPLAPDDDFTVGVRLSRLRRARFRYRPAQPNARMRWFTEKSLRLCLGPVDVFHGLDARIPADAPFPCVATIHDVGPAVRPDIASAEFRSKKLAAYKTIAERAWRIVCVSAATRDSFRRLFDVPEHRFHVIHHGVDPRFHARPQDEVDRVLAELSIAPPYLLFLGLLGTRKNIETLARAFDRVAGDIGDLRLVLAGGRAHGFDAIEQEIRALRHADRVVLPGFVPDEAVPALYAGARAFVFPGLTEGFGMPMLEAMACGTPVLAADTAVGREVAGGAALLVDTGDERALAESLATLGADDALRARLVKRGAARVARFTWEAAAEKTLAVYREVAAERAG